MHWTNLPKMYEIILQAYREEKTRMVLCRFWNIIKVVNQANRRCCLKKLLNIWKMFCHTYTISKATDDHNK